MNEIWSELRRRNVFRVAVAYAVMGWVLLQVASLIAPALGLPGWAFSFVLFVLIIGFPLALLFAWAFELTPEGLKRAGDVDRQASVTVQTGRKFDFVIIGVLSVALLFFIVDRLFMAAPESSAAPQEVVRSSIAVLPFVNMSNDPDQVYFSDGISEEILNVLAKIPDLHVTSRSSAFQYRGDNIHIPTVAEQLGVANILEGSVRKSGSRIRITAQLIDASTDRHLWTNTYDRELTDIFAIQDEISKAIVDALHVHLGLEPATMAEVKEVDVEAYRLYLLGRHNFEQRTQDTLYKAIDFFDQAIAIDPGYAPAYSGKADAYLLLSSYGDLSRAEAASFADPLIERALELDPDLADVYASKGLSLQQAGRIEASLLAFDRAIDLNPNLARAWHWKAISLSQSLQFEQELAAWRQAHALDPLSPVIFDNLISSLTDFGHSVEAVNKLEALRSMAPDLDRTRMAFSYFYWREGRWAENYILASQEIESPTENDSFRLGITLGSLKALAGSSVQFSRRIKIQINATVDPEITWTEYQRLPEELKGDPAMVYSAAWAGVHLGKYREVIELWEGATNFSEDIAGPMFNLNYLPGSAAPSLALARRRIGDEAGARRLENKIENLVSSRKEQGATGNLAFLEAELHALRGEDSIVIAALEQAHKDGDLTWPQLTYRVFDSIRNREDFQAIVRAVDAKVNEERAKLGWEPVE